MREYVIERQNQKIENLVQQINKIKFELTIAQEQLQLIQKVKHYYYKLPIRLLMIYNKN